MTAPIPPADADRAVLDAFMVIVRALAPLEPENRTLVLHTLAILFEARTL